MTDDEWQNDPFDSGRSSLIEHQYDDETPASIAIVRALCAVENVEPRESPEALGVTLFDAVDPEALDEMMGDGNGTGSVIVTFTLADYQIYVRDDGEIRIDSE